MKLHEKILNSLLKMFLGLKETPGTDIGSPKKIMVIRQHNQLGDLIVATPLFRALREKYPEAEITAVVSPQNRKALERNPLINNIFVFDKKRLAQPDYLKKLYSVFRNEYDLVIVPSITSLSFTSNLLARFSNSRIRIGPASLNGEINHSSFFFDKRVVLDWRAKEDTHAADRNLDILKPFKIETDNLQPIIYFNDKDMNEASNFIAQIKGKCDTPIVGVHAGAGKIQNRWHHDNFANLLIQLRKNFNARIYLSMGGRDDDEIVKLISSKCDFEINVFDKPGISLLTALIEQSNLFITNDTGPMHAAAASNTATVSLFGPTNPKMWAPIGKNKFYLHKGNDINLIEVEDVYRLAEKILTSKQ